MDWKNSTPDHDSDCLQQGGRDEGKGIGVERPKRKRETAVLLSFLSLKMNQSPNDNILAFIHCEF